MKEIKDIEEMPLIYKKKEKDTRSGHLPSKIQVNEEFLRLAGYYIAEGSSHGRSVIFSVDKSETKLIEDISYLMKNIFGLNSHARSKSRGGNGVDIVFYSSYMAEVFKEMFSDSATTKSVPHEFMFLPIEKQRSLISGLWKGDGCFMEAKAEYTTISVVLAEQMKMLLLRQGIVPIVRAEPAHGNHKTAYRLYVSYCDSYNRLAQIVGVDARRANAGRNNSFTLQNGMVYLPISKIETFDYNGTVYDLTIDSTDHTFVTNVTASGNCGDFGVFASVNKALQELNIDRHNVVMVSGIGCSSAMPHTFSTYGVHSLHGRLLPVASGIKLANHNLTVIGTGGDGDGYGIGGGHLVHSARRNIDITYIVMNNETYGLTTGQTSPTALMGRKTKSTPFGAIEMPINPMALAISAGATYVARGFSGDPAHLAQLIKGGIEHRGFALIDVFSPCVTFNKDNTSDWFRQRIYKLEGSGHDPSNLGMAMQKAIEDMETKYEKVPIGLFYKTSRPTYEELEIAIKDGPLISQQMPTKEQIQSLLEENR